MIHNTTEIIIYLHTKHTDRPTDRHNLFVTNTMNGVLSYFYSLFVYKLFMNMISAQSEEPLLNTFNSCITIVF